MIYLVHHAQAVDSDVDTQRPLSPTGRMHADDVARQAAARSVKPAAIWHSGKLRARQTAEAFLRVCNPLAEFGAIRGLQPTDPPRWIRDLVREEARDVMLVGHMPQLPRVLTLLVSGSEAVLLDYPLHGVVALEKTGERWEERWRLS
jgi:phosphohistidine phosphatase